MQFEVDFASQTCFVTVQIPRVCFWKFGFGGHQTLGVCIVTLLLRNPIAVKHIPTAMGIGAHARFANQGGIQVAAFAPTPAHHGQMNAAGRLVANGAVFAFSQRDAVALTAVRVLVADVTKFYGHGFVTHRRRARGFLQYGRRPILAHRITQISRMDIFAAPIDFVNQLSRVILTQQ